MKIAYIYRTRLADDETWEEYNVHVGSFQEQLHEAPLRCMREMGVGFMLIRGEDRLGRDRFWEFTLKENT